MNDAALTAFARELMTALESRRLVLATAESCTGGWVAKTITDLPGSSRVFDRGFVTYSNQAKQEMLGVRRETLERFGAVSEQTVAEMAKGAVLRSGSDAAVSVSGIAGPSGGTQEKPVGTVWFGWRCQGNAWTRRYCFSGDRDAVRRQAVATALQGLISILESGAPGDPS